MKKCALLVASVLSGIIAFGQNSTSWPAVTTPLVGLNNSLQSGYVGIGIRPNASSTLLPNFNFHLHGTTDFIVPNNPLGSDAQTGMIPTITDEEIAETNGMLTKSTINYGKTIRFGMTNVTTGLTLNDGVVFQLSDNHFSIFNREIGSFSLGVPNVSMTLSSETKRIWMGGSSMSTSPIYASLNVIRPIDNGVYVQGGIGKYGLRVKTVNNSDDALQVFGANSTIKNFKVTGAGEVFARRYTTTLNNIPDYVFNPNYKLLSLEELRSYISTNKHLPNVPSANEFAETGVDLGELNRVLLEKVEELTLYILQLEDRMKMLEAGK